MKTKTVQTFSLNCLALIRCFWHWTFRHLRTPTYSVLTLISFSKTQKDTSSCAVRARCGV